MTTAYFPLTQRQRRKLRKRTLSMRIRIGNFTLAVTLIILICLLSIAQILHANNIQTKGYEIRELEQQRQALIVVNQALRMTETEAQSLAQIEDSDVVNNMQLVVDPIVISSENAVAVK